MFIKQIVGELAFENGNTLKINLSIIAMQISFKVKLMINIA